MEALSREGCVSDNQFISGQFPYCIVSRYKLYNLLNVEIQIINFQKLSKEPFDPSLPLQ